MKALMDRLGYHFKNETLLLTALTHPSMSGDKHLPNYQRLEFLGDAVLELAVSRYLFTRYPNVQEGKLTFARARLVREEALFAAAAKFDLGRFIRLSPGEEHTGGRKKPSIVADVMEAVFAAVYLDGGYDAAEKLILTALSDALSGDPFQNVTDYKSRLQMLTQKNGGATPTYELISSSGEAHRPTFTMRVMLNGEFLAEGTGSSKQAAQQQAAQIAYNKLKGSANGCD